jgi:two-component system chemotaxis sensor kinase CheA
VVERIADPLMHLVRNALDHGLETPDAAPGRRQAAQGRLHAVAPPRVRQHPDPHQDDGRGIHRDKVLQRAWERGLVERGVTPPDADILNLIFEPGFSTAEQVTNLSAAAAWAWTWCAATSRRCAARSDRPAPKPGRAAASRSGCR